jgi:hypothetical protein
LESLVTLFAAITVSTSFMIVIVEALFFAAVDRNFNALIDGTAPLDVLVSHRGTREAVADVSACYGAERGSGFATMAATDLVT